MLFIHSFLHSLKKKFNFSLLENEFCLVFTFFVLLSQYLLLIFLSYLRRLLRVSLNQVASWSRFRRYFKNASGRSWQISNWNQFAINCCLLISDTNIEIYFRELWKFSDSKSKQSSHCHKHKIARLARGKNQKVHNIWYKLLSSLLSHWCYTDHVLEGKAEKPRLYEKIYNKIL